MLAPYSLLYGDSEKLFIFYKKLQENKQDGIQAILYTSKAMEKTYRQLVDMLIRADPPVIKAHKANALTEEKQPCQGFAKGHCKFGDECRFSHKAVTQPPGSKGSDKKTSDKSKQPARDKYKPPPSNTISAENRANIGAPRGKPTDKNPEGYSKAQILMFKAAASEYTDNWQDPAYFNTQANNQSSVSMNMFKVEEGRSPRLASPVPSTAPVVATPEGLNRPLTAVIENQSWPPLRASTVPSQRSLRCGAKSIMRSPEQHQVSGTS
jgi:Zinc finger C-x8-C-x5-C-x3-H type (and similar)